MRHGLLGGKKTYNLFPNFTLFKILQWIRMIFYFHQFCIIGVEAKRIIEPSVTTWTS